MFNKDVIAGFLLLALAAVYYAATLVIPDSSLSDAVGAAGLPRVLAAALALLSLALVVKGGLAARQADEPSAEPDGNAERSTIPRALGFVLIGVGYMIVAPLTGYAIGIALAVIAIALYERERLSLRLAAVAAGGGIAFWLIFVRLLGTEQPISRLLG